MRRSPWVQLPTSATWITCRSTLHSGTSRSRAMTFLSTRTTITCTGDTFADNQEDRDDDDAGDDDLAGYTQENNGDGTVFDGGERQDLRQFGTPLAATRLTRAGMQEMVVTVAMTTQAHWCRCEPKRRRWCSWTREGEFVLFDPTRGPSGEIDS